MIAVISSQGVHMSKHRIIHLKYTVSICQLYPGKLEKFLNQAVDTIDYINRINYYLLTELTH